jgi:hypothetical protein
VKVSDTQACGVSVLTNLTRLEMGSCDLRGRFLAELEPLVCLRHIGLPGRTSQYGPCHGLLMEGAVSERRKPNTLIPCTLHPKPYTLYTRP